MTNQGYNGFDFPYIALSPVTGTQKEFKDMDDVYTELETCYEELINKNVGALGETLYIEHFYFCNTYDLIDTDIQDYIKKYNFSKKFNIPPYPSIQEIPANEFDIYTEIANEIDNIEQSNKRND